MDFKEIVGIVFVSILETLIIMAGLVVIINLVQFNYGFVLNIIMLNMY